MRLARRVSLIRISTTLCNIMIQGDDLRLEYDAMRKQEKSDKKSVGEQEWEECTQVPSNSVESSNTAKEISLPSKKTVVKYLNEHVAHSLAGAQKIVDRVTVDSVVKKEDFLLAVYLLKAAVRKAQQSVFDLDSGDEEESDPLARVQKKISYGQEDEDDNEWKINTAVRNDETSSLRSQIPNICLDTAPLDEEEACGPLGLGMLSMRGVDSLAQTEKEDPWTAFDADSSMCNGSARGISAHGHGDMKGMQASGQGVSLTTAYKKLIGPIPGTSILPLTDSEKKVAIDSFIEKGYEHSGGMPIRDAIDMYHKLDTKHVHFSKIWALVDPQTVCKIDKRYFCAFIALVQNIIQQGEAVKLPKVLTDEDVSRLILELVVDPTNQGGIHLDLKTLTRHNETMWDINSGNFESPRRLEGTECSDSDFESDDGISVVSRIPSFARSLGSMSFRGMKNFILHNRNKNRYENGPSTMGRCSSIRAPSFTTHKIDAAAWREMAGGEDTKLEITFLYAALGTRKKFGDIFAEFELRDSTNRLLTLPVETTPGVQNRSKGTVKFERHPKLLETMLENIPPGATLFFSLKQWKESKNKMSTIAWSYVDCDMVCDFGTISKVRRGNVALPLFKKPMDLSKHQTKRLNGNHPCLYISISGK
jgi:hypothetical protein